MAKTDDKVNRNYTQGFTSRNSSLVLGTHGITGLRRLGGRLRTACKIHMFLLPFSIHSHGTTARTLTSLPRA